jgi:lipopolysaccharide assembly protein A
MRLLKTIFMTLLFILAITFAMKNQETVSLRYYFTTELWTVPLFILVFVSVLVGILIAGMGSFFSGVKLKQEIRRKQKTILELQKELNSLRNLPLTESKRSDEFGEE